MAAAASAAPAKRAKRKATQRKPPGRTNGSQATQESVDNEVDQPVANAVVEADEPQYVQLLGGGPAPVTNGAEPAAEAPEQPAEEKVPDAPAPSVPKRIGPPEGMYPEDADLFTFTPPSTKDTIYFPFEFKQPGPVRMWELYELPWHVQTWEYMKMAGVPRVMQRKAVELMEIAPDEYLDLFNSWMAVNGARPSRDQSALGE